MIVLRRDVVSLSISLSIILAAPSRCPAHSTDRTSDFPQRIAQASLSPQSSTSRPRHRLASARPGERPLLYNRSGGRPTATERSEGRAWQSLGQQIGSLQHPHAEGSACEGAHRAQSVTWQSLGLQLGLRLPAPWPD